MNSQSEKLVNTFAADSACLLGWMAAKKPNKHGIYEALNLLNTILDLQRSVYEMHHKGLLEVSTSSTYGF